MPALFYLDPWAMIRRLPESDAQAEAGWPTRNTAGQQLRGARGVALGEAVWARAVGKASALRAHLVRRGDGKRVGNRAFWRGVIEPQAGSH